MAVSFSAEALYRWPAIAALAQLASRTFETIVLSQSLFEKFMKYLLLLFVCIHYSVVVIN